MSLLAAALYDPSTAVAKSTQAALAMTALDTTHLRLTFTAPPSGNVMVVMRCAMLGGTTTFPQILLGVLQSSTVIGRVAPVCTLNGTNAAATRQTCDACFEVTGLTAGTSYTWDAAYGVEVAIATTSNIEYGGPNDATGADAWGAFRYAIYSV